MGSSHSTLSQRKAEISQVVNGCILVSSRVVLESPPDVARRLRAGIAYGHSIVFEKNLALWPLEFAVVSEIKHENQLTYQQTGGPRHWAFMTSLLPYRGEKQTALLLCIGNKVGHDELQTTIACNTGIEALLTLEVEIE